MTKLADAALAYLQARDATINLRIAYEQTKEESIWRAAFDAGEREETARRVLGDAIIADDPDQKPAVRKIVRFSTQESYGGFGMATA